MKLLFDDGSILDLSATLPLGMTLDIRSIIRELKSGKYKFKWVIN